MPIRKTDATTTRRPRRPMTDATTDQDALVRLLGPARVLGLLLAEA
ncbi:hypothetical protein [Streptomyces coeruleorubidus]